MKRKHIISSSLSVLSVGVVVVMLGAQSHESPNQSAVQNAVFAGQAFSGDNSTPAMKLARKRYQELGNEIQELYDKAARVHLLEIKGDRPRIEKLLRERISIMGDSPMDEFSLANFYFIIGRDKDALSEFKLAVAARQGVSTSFSQEPRFMTKFGDLALKLGDDETARALYASSGLTILNSGDFNKEDVPDDKLQALKEAAHAATADQKINHGDFIGALADFKIAMPLIKGSLKARLKYGRLLARTGHAEEAKAEFRAAEKMAPDVESTIAIHKERVHLGLINTVTISAITNGKFSTYVKELPDKD
jgi:tetratricopeptide (TPR) repeat protein